MRNNKFRRDYFNNMYKTSWRRRLSLMKGRAQALATRQGYGKIAVTTDELEEKLESQDYCDYLSGWSLDLEDVGNPFTSPSLARLDPLKGFTNENTVIVSYYTARAKGEGTVTEYAAHCAAIAKLAGFAQPKIAEAKKVEPEGKIDVYSSPNAMSNMMQRQLEEMNIAPLTGLRDLSWKEGRE